MKKIVSLVLTLAIAMGCVSVLADVSGKKSADYEPALYELAEKYGFKIGICLSPDHLGVSSATKIISCSNSS